MTVFRNAEGSVCRESQAGFVLLSAAHIFTPTQQAEIAWKKKNKNTIAEVHYSKNMLVIKRRTQRFTASGL